MLNILFICLYLLLHAFALYNLKCKKKEDRTIEINTKNYALLCVFIPIFRTRAHLQCVSHTRLSQSGKELDKTCKKTLHFSTLRFSCNIEFNAFRAIPINTVDGIYFFVTSSSIQGSPTGVKVHENTQIYNFIIVFCLFFICFNKNILYHIYR